MTLVDIVQCAMYIILVLVYLWFVFCHSKKLSNDMDTLYKNQGKLADNILHILDSLEDKEEGSTELDPTLIEGIEGVTQVSITPIRYVELLTKEAELSELKVKLKED